MKLTSNPRFYATLIGLIISFNLFNNEPLHIALLGILTITFLTPILVHTFIEEIKKSK